MSDDARTRSQERRAKKWNPVFRKTGAITKESIASGDLNLSPDAIGPRRRRGLADLFAGGAVLRAIGVAIVVGTILNLINQGEALIGHGKVEWAKLALTYSVPFFVSLHGALHARPRGRPDERP